MQLILKGIHLDILTTGGSYYKCVYRFPSDSVYAINYKWRLFTIGNSPLGFG